MLFKKKLSNDLTITDCKVQPNFRIQVTFLYQNKYQADCLYGWGNKQYSTFSVNSAMPQSIANEIEELLNEDYCTAIREYLINKVNQYKQKEKLRKW